MAEDECKFGCYPVDAFFYKEDGLEIDKVIELLENMNETQVAEFQERMENAGITLIHDIDTFRVVVNALQPLEGADIGERIIDAMKDELSYTSGLGEPYVDKDDRRLVVSSGTQGSAMNIYRYLLSLLEDRYEMPTHLVQEWLNVSPRSQQYEQMMQQRRNAEQTLAQVISNINDLYQQKHLVEHDLRKLRQRQQSFKEERGEQSKGEADTVAKEEALKADFVDLVDAQTGRHSILQMQANNIFPTITADFYRMSSIDDLMPREQDGTGILADIPENEKAILRKKWELYRKWKDHYGDEVDRRVSELERRLNSLEMSIRQTEDWLRPYIRTMLHIQGSEGEELDKLTDAHMLQGYSTSWRGAKLLAPTSARKKDNEVTHYDTLVTYIDHLQLASSEDPRLTGQGGEAVAFAFKEYVTCRHVHETAFQSQVDEKKEQVKRFLQLYVGEKTWKEALEQGLKQHDEDGGAKKKRPGKLSLYFGNWDAFYVPPEELSDLRKQLIGPPHTVSLYLDLKMGSGLFTMK